MQIYGETVFRLDGLALGALLALSMRDARLERRITMWLKPLLIVAVIVIATIICRDGSYFQGRNMLVWGGSALAVLSAGAVFYCRQIGGPLRSRLLHSFGKYSYGMYIWHYPLAERIRIELLKLNGHVDVSIRWELFGAVVIGGIIVSWAISWLSWRLIEAPSLDLRDRVMARKTNEKTLARAASAV
jgi:peptidoglycan/LPS O-acetylase OafA/YrhL